MLKREVAEREPSRIFESSGLMEALAVGDYVSVAQPRKVSNSVVMWTGLWKVVASGRHLNTVEDIMSGQRTQVLVVRMRLYSDAPQGATNEF